MRLDETFAELVAESGDRLLRLAFQLTHDRATAEDVVQEALLRMYRSWSRRVPDVTDRHAYARRAVVNEFLRRRRKRESSEVVTADFTESAGADEFARVVDRDELWRTLAALPARQRTVIVLRYYEDLPDDRIADLIDAKPATVRSLAARGLAALRSSQALTPEHR